MGNFERLPIAVGKTEYFNGYKVSAIRSNPRSARRTPGETALHEIEHAVAGERNGSTVELASIIPGPGYLGITKLNRFDAVAAVAPHANGRGGTSHDLSIIEYAGANVDAATKVAKSILSKDAEKIHEIACELEEKKTLSGTEIRQILNNPEPNENETITLFITSPTGEQTTLPDLQAKNEVVLVEGEWIEVK